MTKTKSESYIDRIEKRAVDIWRSVVKTDGVKMILSPEEFVQEMQDEEIRVKSIIESGILCSPTIVGFTPGLRNYFVINDSGYGEVCEKCGSSGAVVLLMDKNHSENLDKKVFLPSFGTYYNCRVQPEEPDFVRMFPVPINHETDYWYCPYCKELHRFTYDYRDGLGVGLEYDQEVVAVHWKPEKVERYNDKDIELWKLLFWENRLGSITGDLLNHGAEIEPTHEQLEQAKETGLPVLIAKWMNTCNDPSEDCSWDVIYKFVLPDGSIKGERNHLY